MNLYKQYLLDSECIKMLDMMKRYSPYLKNVSEHEIIKASLKVMTHLLGSQKEWTKFNIPTMQLVVRAKAENMATYRQPELFDVEIYNSTTRKKQK